MSKFRLYEKVKQILIYDGYTFIIAEVNWDYSHEFPYEDNWKKRRSYGFYDYHDQSIHYWVEKYHPQLNIWLNAREIKWRGIQSGDTEENNLGSRGFTVICIKLDMSEHLVEFLLTWG